MCQLRMKKVREYMGIMKKTGILIYQMIRKTSKDRVRAHAAEAGFFIIMSVFPILMLLLTLLRYTPLTADQIIFTIEELTPFEVTPEIQPIVNGIYNQSSALVPWTALVALWTAGKGILGLSDGLNSIFQIEESRNYFITRFRCACYTVVLIIALVVSLVILVFGYNIENFLMQKLPVLQNYQDEMVVLPTGIALVILVILFSVLFAYLPNRRLPFLKQVPGAVFSSVTWAVFSYAFSIYLDYAVNMSVIYGSLTTLVVVMLWLYCCMYLLFIGAEINHYLTNPEFFALDR